MTKLSLSRAWDETRGVLARDGKLIGAVALALFYLPGVIAGVIQPDSEGVPSTNAALITMLVIAIIGLVGQLAIIRLALGNHGTVAEAIRHGAVRTPPYLVSGLIWVFPFAVLFYLFSRGLFERPPTATPGEALATLVILIALIFLSVRLMMSSAVASAEQAGPIAILRRSWELTRGNWWRLFAFLAAFLFVAVVALSAAGAIAGIVSTLIFGEAHAMTVSALFISLLVELVTTLITIVFLVMVARIYAQLALPAPSVPSSGT